MAEFNLVLPEIPAEPSNADLAQLLKASFEAARSTHDCLEQHRKTTEAGNIVLASQNKSNSDQLQALAQATKANTDGITDLTGIVTNNIKNIKVLTGSARAISKSVKEIDKKVTAAATEAAEAKKTAKDTKKIIDDIGKNFWQVVIGVLIIVIAGGILAVGGIVYNASINAHTLQAIQEQTAKKP